MKPDFALNLTHDSIGLLHRTSRGWLEVGSAALDDPDLPEALGYLRRSALGLSPAGFTTKLVIPNSEILYLTVDAPGPDKASRKTQVRAALEGRTPYAVDELVFDWWGRGPAIHIAVVTRETLEQAEAFAAEHRFNPVSFVAIPDGAAFGGEPWFGPTTHAATLLRPGEKVERDQDPVNVVAREMPRSPPDTDVRPIPADPGPPDAAAAELVSVAEQSEPQPPLLPTAEAATSANDAATRPADQSDPEPATADPDPLTVEDADHPAPLHRAIRPAPLPAVPDPATMPLVVTIPDVPDPVAPPDAVAVPVAPRPSGPVATTSLSAVPLAAASLRAEVPADPQDGALPEARPLPVRRFGAPVVPGVVTDTQVVEPESAVTFASRRARSPDGGGTGPAPMPLQTALAVAARGTAHENPATSGATAPDAPKRTATMATIATPDASAGTADRAAAGARPAVRPPAAPAVADPRSRVATTKLPGSARPVPTAVPQAVPQKAVTDPRRDPSRAGTAVPDGFGSRPSTVPGKPRFLGLILTGVLLLLLAVVAAWSSFYLASGKGSSPVLVSSEPVEQPEPPVVAPSADGASDSAAGPAEAPPPAAMAPAAIDPASSAVTPSGSVPVAPAPAPATRIVAAAPDPVVAEPAAEQQPFVLQPAVPQPAVPPVADVAAPGVAAVPQDEIILSSSDQPPTIRAAAPLPVPAANPDPIPETPLAPPPFGTVYAFDAAGRIVPTPEGVVTPEGVMLFAGKPVKVPPGRPMPAEPLADVVPAAIDPADVPVSEGDAPREPTLGGIGIVGSTPASTPDPSLAGIKPRTRPAGLSPAQEDTAAPAAPSDPRLAGLRPATRPAEIVAAVSARQQTEAASLAIAEAAAAAPVPSGSPLAIAVSGRPAPRPDNFAKAVESAVAAAVREAPPEPVEVAAVQPPAAQATLRVRQPTVAEEPARIAPEDDGEPEQASAPVRSVNNRGTVAKNATFANAINLRDINLIGVYGSQSSRYALIRQANGRYKKVKVGDRIGGGTIAAITADQVRYQKGNRMYALEMPRG